VDGVSREWWINAKAIFALSSSVPCPMSHPPFDRHQVHPETTIARGESGCDHVGFASLRLLSLMFKLKDGVLRCSTSCGGP
jgi:hypothetical protein